jgi:alpha-mannosidase
MLCKQHYEKMVAKLQRFEETLNPYLFTKIQSIPATAFVVDKQFHSIPTNESFKEISCGWKWGGEGAYCWLKAEYVVPEELDGKDIFIMPKMGGYEAMLWVDGIPFGTFNTKIVYTSHGNHYCGLIKKNAKAHEKIDIAIEYYAGHDYHGCDPFSRDLRQVNTYNFTFESLDICVKNEDVNKFYFDLKIITQLATELPNSSFMKAQAINALTEVHKILYYSPEDVSKKEFFGAIKTAQPYLTKVLSLKNGDAAPIAGLIGHSHMDTAWLWHVDETIKKCARTYSNQISLMEQYPEHRFVQSSSCHSDMVRKYYPELFTRIQQKVAEGRYEPNGAVWVECDCNITSGESMIRQFLWGQRFTEKYFNYRSNAFWLPDTFGYSASIPQIMKGCGVDYFLTTKINWNDTNAFPYNTFYWQGIDGTKVFSHFNTTHSWPDARELRDCLVNDEHQKDQPTVTNKRLMTYGYGDGGGGPQFEMIETARRCEDLYDVPKTYHTTVSDFMKDLESTCVNPNTYRGELYLELHRGTLTNQHEIKYNNRKAEIALRDLEFLTVCESLKRAIPCSAEKTNKLYETLLLNQFHDILPGTCINRAHEECKAQMREIIKGAREQIENITNNSEDCVSVTNSLSFDRNDVIFADDKGKTVANVVQQTYTDISGKNIRLINGVDVPAFSSIQLNYGESKKTDNNPFNYDENTLTTPFAKIQFDENGFISSFVDIVAQRELVDGLPFNTFLMAEDVPMSWDNWDIDADIEMKFKPCAILIEREVVSSGEVAFIIRSKYKISEKSTITQDMIFFADSPEVRFDTYMDWQDDHRFLKTSFDTDVREDFARHEIQFGYCKRPTTRNNSIEQAKFEVVNHKYTDLSEPNYGVTVLNDCKYGISVNGSQICLSLHKGGNHPDVKGDKGLHHAVYSFLPHNCAFSAEAVIQPAYRLNIPHIVSDGIFEITALVNVDKANIVVESIKPCEDEDKAFIIRLYEAEGTRTNSVITLNEGVNRYTLTNMLEENIESIVDGNVLNTQFRPFEIKTIKAYY